MKAPLGLGADFPSPTGDGFFAALADAIPIMVFMTAPDGTIEWYNARWFQYTGFTPEQTYANYGYRNAVHPDDVQRLIDCGRNARASGLPSTTDARYRRKDGVFRWHRVTAIPYRGDDGQIVRWLGTAVDIDESYIADRALNALSNASGLLVWSLAPDGSDLRYHGRARRSLHLMHPSDRPDVLRAIQHALQTGEPMHYVLRMAVGEKDTYRWQRVAMVAVRNEDGTIARWYGVTMDIHDELLSNRSPDQDVEIKVLRDLTRHTPALLFITDTLGEVTFVNERWRDVTGRSSEQLVGPGIRALMHPDDFESASAAWQNRRVGEELVMEYRLLCADGRYRWIETRSLAETDDDGYVTRWIGVGLDVDRQKRMLAALDFIIDTGASIASGTDEQDVLRRLAQATLDGLADICAIDLLDPQPRGTRIVVAADNVERHVVESIAAFTPPPCGESHPIATALYDGDPVFLPEVDASYWESEVGANRRDGWRSSQPHSYMTVPIKANDVIFGAITMLRTVTPGSFEANDLRIVQEVARRAASALVNIRLTRALQREHIDQLEQYKRIADYSPQIMWTADAQGNIEWFNQRWYEYTGQGADDALGLGSLSMVHTEEGVYPFWQHVRDGRTDPYESERLVRGRNGASRWHLVRALPEHDASGNVVRWYGTTIDIDESRRAARTMRAFADLGEALAETIDLQDTLDRAMEVIVPEYADWGHVALADEEQTLIVRAVYDANPRHAAQLRSLLGRPILRPDATGGSALTFARRIPHLLPDGVREHAERNLLPEAIDVFESIGFSAVLTLPLIVNGISRGALVLGMSHGVRTFQEDDLPFYQELARRISPAIANAELFERERRVARSFQEASLPTSLPKLAGYEFDAVYEAGRAEALIGGDWYDAFPLSDGRIVLSIGDVAGSGLRAAVMMSNVRQAIRGVAHVHADPSLMLEAADGIVRTQHPDTYVTAFVGVLDPVTNVLVYQSAGHLRPLLAFPGAGVIELEGGGLPLGLRTKNEPRNCTFELAPSTLLVLYTDGLIEATHSINEGYERVFEALTKRAVVESTTPAMALHDAVLSDGSKDDVAILTLRVGQMPSGVTYKIRNAWYEAEVRSARKSLLEELRRGGMKSDALTIAELILVELTGNLVRYAPGEATLSIMWNEGVPVLHILDSGPGYAFAAKLPTDVMSESGRGLFMVAALAQNLVVTPRMGGGSHTMVVFNL